MITVNDKLIVESYLEENKTNIANKLEISNWNEIHNLNIRAVGDHQSEILFYRKNSTSQFDEVWLEVSPNPYCMFIIFRLRETEYAPNYRTYPWKTKCKLKFTLINNKAWDTEREFAKFVFDKIKNWSAD